MKKLLSIPLLLLSLTTMATCSHDDNPASETEFLMSPEELGDKENSDTPFGNSKILVVYFSAEGHTQAIAERIVELTGADIHRIKAATYLNESMQKIYKITPDSRHIPETLPEDLNADDITTPGRPDDAGIDMPDNANGTEAWLRRIRVIE